MTDPKNTESSLPDLPPLVTMGDPRLARPSAAVEPAVIVSEAFAARLETLAQAMMAYEGIGIAAPQVGWFERFFLMVLESGDGDEPPQQHLTCWINPEIVSASSELCWAWEGCLSVPGLRGWIRRPAAVAVRGLDASGQGMSMELTGWNARVFQHEFDHLEGLLFPYRAADAKHLVMLEQLENSVAWPEDWPAPGARDTPMGALYPDGTPPG